jgi:hypothetical protein
MEVTPMTEMMSDVNDTKDPNTAVGLDRLGGLDEELINQLVDRARTGGLRLTGEGSVLQQLTKRLLESALDGEITDHLGYDRHDPAGRGTGNSRNGTHTMTVLTDVGPVEITVPRDRDASFEPKIVAKWCCATVSGMPVGSTGTRSRKRSSRCIPRRRSGSASSLGSGVGGIRRSCGCGITRGRSSCRFWGLIRRSGVRGLVTAGRTV